MVAALTGNDVTERGPDPRDVSQIMALAHQMYPQRTKYFLEAYTAATARPHGYLVIDMKQETPDILRLFPSAV
jgi:hypothetical protein